MARSDRSNRKRSQLIEAAVTCFHRRGYARVTLADIAKEAGVPLGNLYYYFKTKAALADAAVASWNERQLQIFDELEALPPGVNRLIAFLDRSEEWKQTYTDFGCPLANLARDLLASEEPGLAHRAGELYSPVYGWTQAQFQQMKQPAELARVNSGILVAGLQGAILMAHATEQTSLLTEQVKHLKDWLSKMEKTE